MAKNSRIEWTDHTINPWHGCRKVSPGCDNCYMHRDKKRYGQDPSKIVRAVDNTFNKPLHWKDPAMVFVCSWSDFFIKNADPWRSDFWEVIRKTPHLTYQILTKRPQNIKGRLPDDWGQGYPHVWLGVTAENQAMADERIPILLQIPAAKRFVSVEPMLGPVDIRLYLPNPSGSLMITASGREYINRLDWVICGGETGPGSRPMHPDWARSLRDQCQGAGVPFLFKQWGEWVPSNQYPPELNGVRLSRYMRFTFGADFQHMFHVGKKAAGRLLDGQLWDQYPTEGVRP